MSKSLFIRCLFFTLFLLAACNKFQVPAPVTLYGSTQGEGSAGVHTVVGNETLWNISQRYQLAMRDIAAVNGMAPPFDLTPGQRLRLPPPRQYRARPGDTLYSVSRLFSVPTSDIAKLNGLKAPYSLKGDEVLRLPTLTRKTEAVVIAQGEKIKSREIVKPAARPVVSPAARPFPAIPPKVGGGVVSPPVVVKAVLPPPEVKVVEAAPEPPPKKTPITAKVPKRASSKFLKPVEGKIISAYGPKKDGLHNDGVNIQAPRGTPVRAAENGVIVYAGNDLEASGNLVIIRHQDKWMTAYAHMDRLLIKRGETIKRGQSIGTVGSSGSVDSPQLHFEVRRGTEALNPKLYFEGGV